MNHRQLTAALLATLWLLVLPASARAQDWWLGPPPQLCTTEGHIWVLTSGAMTCQAQQSLSGYVLITTAGQQSITATGADNDVTLVAADDVLINPGDDFVVTPTAGGVVLNAVGAGEDVSLVAADDVIATATDAFTVTAASATVAATVSFAVDAAGGTDELGVAEGLVGLMGLNIYGAATGPTELGITCDGATAGDLYFDNETELEFCFCNGTNWVKFSDATTQCGDPA